MDTPSGLRVEIVNRIEKFPREDWERIFPLALENYNFFKSLDESSFDQFKFFYLLVYDQGQPVGATSCFIMDFSIDIAVKGALKSFLRPIKKILPQAFNFKTLVCGLVMGQGRIGIAKQKDQGLVMEAISFAVEELAKEQNARLILYKDFDLAYEEIFRPFRKRGYLRLESFPSTDMEIDFADFDEYLKSLSSSSRENLRRNLKKADGKVEIEFVVKNSLSSQELLDVYALYLQTYNNQEMGFEKLPLDFFTSIARNMPEETRFFLWKIKGQPVAFAFCLVSGSYFIDYYLGFDYSVAYRYALYFVRFRGLLEWCINHGIKKYEMGATTYEPKKRLGFNFIRLYVYFKHRNKLINRFAGLISYFVKPEKFDPIFKQMQQIPNSPS